MKNINIIIVILFFVSIFQLKGNETKNLYVAIDVNSCFTCKAGLVDIVFKNNGLKANFKPSLLITNITSKQLKYYRKEIEKVFDDIVVDIKYDTVSKYKNLFKIIYPLEFIVTDKYDNMQAKFNEYNKFADYANNLYKYKKVLMFDDEFHVFKSSINVNKDILSVYDQISKKINMINLNTLSKKVIDFEDLIKQNDIDNNIEIDSILKQNKLDKYRFLAFGQGDINGAVYFSKIHNIKNLNDRLQIQYNYYIYDINTNKMTNIPLGDRYIPHANNEIMGVNGSLYMAVYDKKYKHNVHDAVKDTTSIFIEYDLKKNLLNKTITYKIADSLAKKKFSLFFNPTYSANMKGETAFFNSGNNIYVKLFDHKIQKLLNPTEELLSLYKAQINMNKDLYLEGALFVRNSFYLPIQVLLDNNSETIVLINEYVDLNSNDVKNIIVQKFDKTGELSQTLKLSCDNQFKSYIYEYNGKTYLLKIYDDRIEIDII